MAFSSSRVIMGASGGALSGDETAYSFDGTGDYLGRTDHSNFDFGAGNFTIEMWIKPASATGYYYLYSHDNQNIGDRSLSFAKYDTSLFLRYSFDGANDYGHTSDAITFTTGWQHIAVVRSGTTIYWFHNGIAKGTDTVSGTLYNSSQPVVIGRQNNYSGMHYSGQMDEIRISNIARWTSGFTPETSQYESDANTVLLIHCGETKSGTTGSGATFTDSGNTGHTITEYGNAIEDTVLYKF